MISNKPRTTKVRASVPAQKDLQKEIYQYMKKKAHSYEGPVSRDLILYRKNQARYAQRPFKPCPLKTLVQSIEKSHIVYLGDFHTFDQSSKNLERLVRILQNSRQKLSFGIEFVHENHQEAINLFLAHHLSELEFLEMIDYKESWRFPWTYYRIFFQLARKHQMEIIALNSTGTLKQRDLRAAEHISTHLHGRSDEVMLVLFGEYHIVPNKLPELVKKKMNKDLYQTIIHQNLDDVYWRLQKRPQQTSKHLGPIVRFSANEFSLQTSPPWIKYESMIYWYEHLLEDPHFDMHEYMLETGFMAFNSSVPDTFLYLTRTIAESLGVKIDRFQFDDFNIYDHQKLKIITKKVQKLRPQGVQDLHRHFLLKGKKFKFPFERHYYCSSYSINRIAYLAGLHMLDFILNEKDKNYEQVWIKSSNTTKFIFLCYRFAVGHLSSKIINPYLKCNLYQDILSALQSPKTPVLKKKNYRLVREILDLPHSGLEAHELDQYLKRKGLITVYYCASTIGEMIGDLLYERFFHGPKRDPKNILAVLTDLNFSSEVFVSVLQTLMPEDRYKSQKKRLF